MQSSTRLESKIKTCAEFLRASVVLRPDSEYCYPTCNLREGRGEDMTQVGLATTAQAELRSNMFNSKVKHDQQSNASCGSHHKCMHDFSDMMQRVKWFKSDEAERSSIKTIVTEIQAKSVGTSARNEKCKSSDMHGNEISRGLIRDETKMDDLVVGSNGTTILGDISDMKTTARVIKALPEKYNSVLTVPSEELVLIFSMS